MRIMYTDRAGGVIVKEVTTAYTLGEHKLICDLETFWFENAMPYQSRSVDDLLMMLLREGYLDLRSLRLIAQ